MSEAENKAQLRNKMLAQRRALDPTLKQAMDQAIQQKLRQKLSESQPAVIHTYLSMDDEISFLPVIEELLKQNRTIVAPKALRGGILKNLILNSLDQTEEGVFGTRYPSGENEYSGAYDLIIVPGLAFDAEDNRLGYGGGYYDRFLKGQSGAYKIGLAYPFQIIGSVPVEQHDAKVDEIIST